MFSLGILHPTQWYWGWAYPRKERCSWLSILRLHQAVSRKILQNILPVIAVRRPVHTPTAYLLLPPNDHLHRCEFIVQIPMVLVCLNLMHSQKYWDREIWKLEMGCRWRRLVHPREWIARTQREWQRHQIYWQVTIVGPILFGTLDRWSIQIPLSHQRMSSIWREPAKHQAFLIVKGRYVCCNPETKISNRHIFRKAHLCEQRKKANMDPKKEEVEEWLLKRFVSKKNRHSCCVHTSLDAV